MKKWKSAIPDAGLKYFNKFLSEQGGSEIFDAMEAIFEDFDFTNETEGFVLSGGVVAGSSPSATITESIVALNGKLLRLEAATGLTYPFFIVEATTVDINGDFADLSSKPIIDNEFAEVVASDPGGVQVITVSAAGTIIDLPFAKKRQPAFVAIPADTDANFTITSNAFIKTNDQGVTSFKGTITVEQTGASGAFINIALITSPERPDRDIETVLPANDGVAPIARGVSIFTATGGITVPSPGSGNTWIFDFNTLTYFKNA